MKISQVIGMLQNVLEDCGDIEVVEHEREYDAYYKICKIYNVYNRIGLGETGDKIVACRIASGNEEFKPE